MNVIVFLFVFGSIFFACATMVVGGVNEMLDGRLMKEKHVTWLFVVAMFWLLVVLDSFLIVGACSIDKQRPIIVDKFVSIERDLR